MTSLYIVYALGLLGTFLLALSEFSVVAAIGIALLWPIVWPMLLVVLVFALLEDVWVARRRKRRR